MALVVLLGLSMLFALRAFVGWRTGLMLMVWLAAVQDPLRKLVAGTPGWLVLVTTPVFLMAVLAAMTRRRRWWRDFRREFPGIARGLILLPVLALPAAFKSATYGSGSWMLTVLGAFSYSIIFLAMITGYHYGRSLAEVRKLMAVYCAVNAVMLTGGVFQYLGMFPGWTILGTQALGFEWVRWGQGYTVDMIAGFYRTPDVMGWHAATTAILSLVLAMSARGQRRWLWLGLSAFAVAALLLCGRRKMVYMLPVFLLALVWVYWQAGRATRIAALMGIFLLPALSVWFVGDWVGEGSANIRYYTGEGLQQDAFESIQAQGFQTVIDTYNQTGFFGQGLGFATPGSHNLQVARPRAWQESAPSRIVAELGVPGALGFLSIIVMIVLSLWRRTIAAVRARTPQGYVAAGLVAFFLANVGSLTVSGQILADPFIASWLGLLVGIALAVPALPERRAKVKRASLHATEPVPAPMPVPDLSTLRLPPS